ncbi:MAG: type I secretion system permease/ATPase, partial [Pseudolabrys sp.]
MPAQTTTRARPKTGPATPLPSNPGDPLADALLFLAAHHGRAISREALLAGLPILDGRLPPPLFERAAAKAGLEAKTVRRRLSEIPALVLPTILSMRDGSTRILLAIDLDTKIASVVDPSSNAPAQSRALAELSDEYLGFAFLVRPASAADARAVAAGDLPRAHWFGPSSVAFGRTTA